MMYRPLGLTYVNFCWVILGALGSDFDVVLDENVGERAVGIVGLDNARNVRCVGSFVLSYLPILYSL